MGHQSASTVVSAVGARNVVGHQSASTVVSAERARSAVVHQSASTVVRAISARSAVVHQSASTVVIALSVRSAVGHRYASMVVSAEDARSARSSERFINQITTSQSVLVFTHSSRTPSSSLKKRMPSDWPHTFAPKKKKRYSPAGTRTRVTRVKA